jgi:hypothetical protein
MSGDPGQEGRPDFRSDDTCTERIGANLIVAGV